MAKQRFKSDSPEGVDHDNLVLDEWFTKHGYPSKNSEFDLIYVNGTNHLENLKAPGIFVTLTYDRQRPLSLTFAIKLSDDRSCGSSTSGNVRFGGFG